MNFGGNMMAGGNPKIFKLDSLIVSTNYGNKPEVRKACEEILRNYDSLDCYNIPNPDRQPARVIELYGTVPVNFKGRFYHVMLSFIFPPLYPNVPPLVHFVNPDAKRFMALQKYDVKKVLFPNGKYYYPIFFSEVASWMSHRSVMRVIKQAITEFGNEYPLYECTGQQNQNLFKEKVNPFANNGVVAQQPTNPQNVSAMISSQLPSSNNLHLNPNPNPFGQPNVMGNQNSKDSLLVPIKKRYSEEALQVAKKLEKDLNLQRNNMVELQNVYLKLQEEDEKLQKFEAAAPAIISDLEGKVAGLDQIISTHSGTVLNLETLKTTIEENDVASKMLLDLVTTNKAIEDLNLMAEDLFNSGRIDLETYLKVYKDNSEREFLNNYLMRKIASEQGH